MYEHTSKWYGQTTLNTNTIPNEMIFEILMHMAGKCDIYYAVVYIKGMFI